MANIYFLKLSLISILFFAFTNANSQIIYTDIVPDSTVSEFQQGYAIDFNNDSKNDVHLVLLSNTGVWVMRLIPDDSEDFTYVINDGGDDGGAAVLNFGDNISSSSNLYHVGSGWGDLLYGYWDSYGEYGYWTDTQEDKYLGIKFEIGSNFHYAWVHLTTNIYATDNMEFTIKGFAYNSVSDEEIFAGQTNAPFVITYLPSQNAVDVETDIPVSVTFNEDITEVDFSTVEIRDAENVQVSGVSAQIETDSRTLTISHDDFEENITYTVFIPSNSIQNSATIGNELITWSFTTETGNNISLLNSEVYIYPNPSNGQFIVEFLNIENIQNIEINILDITGKIIYNSSFKTGKLNIDLSSCYTGIYFIKMKANNEIYTGKIVLK